MEVGSCSVTARGRLGAARGMGAAPSPLGEDGSCLVEVGSCSVTAQGRLGAAWWRLGAAPSPLGGGWELLGGGWELLRHRSGEAGSCSGRMGATRGGWELLRLQGGSTRALRRHTLMSSAVLKGEGDILFSWRPLRSDPSVLAPSSSSVLTGPGTDH